MGEDTKQLDDAQRVDSEDQVPAGTTETGETSEGAAMSGEVEGQAKEPSVDELIAQREAEIRKEYEGEGGHLSKVRAAEQKRAAELERKLREFERKERQQAQMELEQARKVAQRDPAAAAQHYEQALARQQALDQQRDFAEAWAEFAESEADLVGLDMEDPEVQDLVSESLAGLIEAGRQGETQGRAAEMAYRRKLIEFSKSKEEKRYQSVAEELATAKKEIESIPEIVEKQIRATLADAGVVPEVTAGGAPKKQKEDDMSNLSPSQKIQAGIDQARKERAAKKKALREGR